MLNGAAGSGTERRLGEEVGGPRRASMAGGGAAPGGERMRGGGFHTSLNKIVKHYLFSMSV